MGVLSTPDAVCIQRAQVSKLRQLREGLHK